jgi:hypothetical protein
VSELDDRRQRAREAFYDMLHDEANDDGPVFELSDCVTGAIQTATRVRITPEIERAFIDHPDEYEQGNVRGPLAAAFRAAGFEVEQ